MSFLLNLGEALLGPVLGGVIPHSASDAAVSTAEQAYDDEQNALQISNMEHTTRVAVRAQHFQQTMDVADEDAKESNLMQNYVITLGAADKSEVEKLMQQISQTA